MKLPLEKKVVLPLLYWFWFCHEVGVQKGQHKDRISQSNLYLLSSLLELVLLLVFQPVSTLDYWKRKKNHTHSNQK